MSDDPDRWLPHSPMTEPGDKASRLDGLPAGIDSLCHVIQGVLVHSDWMAAYGLPEPDASARETLPLSQRLLRIADADSRSLAIARPCAIRSVGTCRDYALMLCAMLRQRRIPGGSGAALPPISIGVAGKTTGSASTGGRPKTAGAGSTRSSTSFSGSASP
jgi:hypothetical protein